jgi:hypothetical protein
MDLRCLVSSERGPRNKSIQRVHPNEMELDLIDNNIFMTAYSLTALVHRKSFREILGMHCGRSISFSAMSIMEISWPAENG